MQSNRPPPSNQTSSSSSTTATRLNHLKQALSSSAQHQTLQSLEQWSQSQPLSDLERLGLALSAHQATLTPFFPYVCVRIGLPPGKILHPLLRSGAKVCLMLPGDAEPFYGVVSGLTVAELVLGFNAPFKAVQDKCRDKAVHVRWARDDDDFDTFGEINKASPLLKSVVDFLASPATARFQNEANKVFRSLGRVETDISLSQQNILKSLNFSTSPFTLVEAPLGTGRRRIITALLENLMQTPTNRVAFISPCQDLLDDITLRLRDTSFWSKIIRTGELPKPRYLEQEHWELLQSRTLEFRVQPLTQDDPNQAAKASLQILNDSCLFMSLCNANHACQLQEIVLNKSLAAFTHVIIDEVYPISLIKTMHYLPLTERAILLGGKIEDPSHKGSNSKSLSNFIEFSSESESLFHRLLDAFKSADREVRDEIAGNYLIQVPEMIDMPAPLFELVSKIYGNNWMKIDGAAITSRSALPEDPQHAFDLSLPVLWIDVPPEKNPSRLTSELVNVLEADTLLHIVRHLKTHIPELEPQIVSGSAAQNALVTKALSQWMGTPALAPVAKSLSPVSLDGLVGATRAELVIFSSGICKSAKPLQGYGILGQKTRKCLIILADSDLAKSGSYGPFLQGALNLAESYGGLYWIDQQRRLDLMKSHQTNNSNHGDRPTITIPEYISSLRLNPDQVSTSINLPVEIISSPTENILAGLEDEMEMRNSVVSRPIANPMQNVRENLPERSETRLPPTHSNMTFGADAPARAHFMQNTRPEHTAAPAPARPTNPPARQRDPDPELALRYPTLPREVLLRVCERPGWVEFLRLRAEQRTDELIEALLDEPALEDLLAIVFDHQEAFAPRPAPRLLRDDPPPPPAEGHGGFDYLEEHRDIHGNDPDELQEPFIPELRPDQVPDYPAAPEENPDDNPDMQNQVEAFLAHYDEYCTREELNVVRRHMRFVNYYTKRGDAYSEEDLLEDDRLYGKDDLLQVLFVIFDRRRNRTTVGSILHPPANAAGRNDMPQRINGIPDFQQDRDMSAEPSDKSDSPRSKNASIPEDRASNRSRDRSVSDVDEDNHGNSSEEKSELNDMLLIGKPGPDPNIIEELRNGLEALQRTFTYIEDADIEIILEFPADAKELCLLSIPDWARFKDSNNLRWQRCISRIVDEYENRKKIETRANQLSNSRIYQPGDQKLPRQMPDSPPMMIHDDSRLTAPVFVPFNPPAPILQASNPFEHAAATIMPPQEAPWLAAAAPQLLVAPAKSPFDDDPQPQIFGGPAPTWLPFQTAVAFNPFADPQPQPKPHNTNKNPFEDED